LIVKVGYIDTSLLVAVAFGERLAENLSRPLHEFDRLYSSNLLEAEFRSVAKREKLTESFEKILRPIRWIFPDRSLGEEFRAVLDLGYVRGADLWHLATALYLAPRPESISFLGLDRSQLAFATRIGFDTSICGRVFESE